MSSQPQPRSPPARGGLMIWGARRGDSRAYALPLEVLKVLGG